MPELVHHQLGDGPHVGEPTSGRGEIERRARKCLAATCHAGLDSTVIETRFNVVRSSMPAVIETVRKLRDSLDEHIRMEENEVFPRLMQDLDEEKSAQITKMVNKAGFIMA